MQIVMLGHTNAGKTSYMSAMYRAMTLEGAAGFRVRARNEQDHRQLLSSAQGLLRGRYPEPSDRRSIYPLSLRHAAGPLIDFEWKDHRGGALLDRASSTDTAELLADLDVADAIVLFLDSVDLLRSHVAKHRVRNLTTLVFRAMEARERLTPVVITLTKSDLLDEADYDQLLEPFDSFIAAVGQHHHLIGTLLPVAAGPYPQNVVVPVLFCLYFGLRARVLALHDSLSESVAASSRLAAANTIWHRIGTWWGGGTSNGELARLAYARALQEYQTLEPLLSPLDRLEDLLGDITIF